MAGKRAADHRRRRVPRLLPRPGGAALEPHASATPTRSALTVCDNFIRGTPAWLTDAGRRRRISRCRHDMHRAAAAAPMPDFECIIHAAVDRLADRTTAKYPIETHGRQRQRPAQPARLLPRGSRTTARAGRGLPVLLAAARSTATPTPDCDPDARGLPRQRVLHRPARLLRRVQALRRDAVRQLRPAARPARPRSPARSTTTARG